MNRALREQQRIQRNKKIFELANKIFFLYDSSLIFLNLILVLVFIRHQCVSLMFLYYSFFYLAQAAQHYLIHKFPLIDINKHYVLYRRLVLLICLIDATYLFSCVIFWQKTSAHPIYCALHQYFKIGVWIGIILVFHFIFCMFWAISLIQSYINRRYYLIALGGFEVEQRINQQNRIARQSMMYRQPDFDHSFSIPKANKQKYFKFEDVIDQNVEKYECSICYNQDSQIHFVDAGCGHFYHQNCLLQWAKHNDTCPQCRHKFDKKEQQIELEQKNQSILNSAHQPDI